MKTLIDLFEKSSMPVGVDLSSIQNVADKYNTNIHVFDVEHSGYIAGGGGAGLIEFASVLVQRDGEIKGVRQFINPECDITFYSKKAHGYSNDFVKRYKPWNLHAHAFMEIMKHSINVGYAVQNDLSVVTKQNLRYGIPGSDFLRLDLLGIWMNGAKVKNGKLGQVATILGLPGENNNHKAWDDTVLTAQVMNVMLNDPRFSLKIHNHLRNATECRLARRSNLSSNLVP